MNTRFKFVGQTRLPLIGTGTVSRLISALAAVWCLVGCTATAFGDTAPLMGDVFHRQQRSLNGEWNYILDPYETGKGGFAGFHLDLKPRDKTDRVEYSFDESPTLRVPGDWNTQEERLMLYEGTVWYRHQFEVPAEFKGKRLFLYFDGANYLTNAYLNTKHLGQHEGGFTPFSFEITDKVQAGNNTLIVGVSNTRREDSIPSKVTDWYNYGGIIRDVRLVAVEPTYIRNFRVQLAKGSADHIAGWAQLDGVDYPASVELVIDELGVKQSFPVDARGRAEIQLEVHGLQRWSPEHPKRYAVELKAGPASVEDQIGFRTIEVDGRDILLNGEPIYLRGASLHDENALRGGRAWSREDAEVTLGWAQEMNCNFLRLAHYPHNENIVRLADEKGILLWSELPLYWGIDWRNDKVRQKAKTQFGELIARDGNRASTIIWSICNETGPSKSRNEFLADIAAHVRSLDDTRLVSAALKNDNEFINSAILGDEVTYFTDPLGEHLDVIAFNEYLGWYGGFPSDCEHKEFYVDYNKPLIVSEFGAGCKAGFHADRMTRWSEEYQTWYYQESLDMFMKIPQLRGTTPWVLVDFRSPLRHLPGIQNQWNRKGLVSSEGEKKEAFYVMQEFYRKIKEGEITMGKGAGPAPPVPSQPAELIYHDTFNSYYSDAPLSEVGWHAHFGSEATAFPDTSDHGQAPVRGVALSGPGDDSGQGKLRGHIYSNKREGPVLYWTQAKGLGDIANLDRVELDLRNESTREDLRLALAIDGKWYITGPGCAVNCDAPNEWTGDRQFVMSDKLEWRELNFTPGTPGNKGQLTVGAKVDSLPSQGTITAFGFFDEHPAGATRIDNVELWPKEAPQG